MERMTENQYMIQLLEKIDHNLEQMLQRVEKTEKALQQHKSTSHVFRSMGRKHRHENLRDTQVPGRN